MNLKNIPKYTWAMLIASAVPIAAELWALFDGNPESPPYTWLITQYIPAPIFWLVWGAVTAWVTKHFIEHYRSENG